MAYHTFVSGEVLTAANVMNDLMNQSVIACTSGTRPASPVAGMTIYETDTGNLSVYSGTAWVAIGVSTGSGAWTSYTPTLTNITNATLISAAYRLRGKSCEVRAKYTVAASFSVSPAPGGIGLPFNAVADAQFAAVIVHSGSRYALAADVTTATPAVAYLSAGTGNFTTSAPVAVGIGDTFGFTGTYETT